MTSGIKAVAFDIDGTLYPSWRLYIRIIPYVLKHLRFFLKYSKVRAILHRTAPSGDFYEYQARLLALELGVDNESARNMIEAIVYKGMMPYLKAVKPYAHIRETIQAFKDKGYKLAILSDFPPEQKGDIWGTRELFDVICGSEELGALKPSKYTFGSLALRLGLPPEAILYVGNSVPSDVEGATAAGMRTAYILPFWRSLLGLPLKEADISFKNYRQLEKSVLN